MYKIMTVHNLKIEKTKFPLSYRDRACLVAPGMSDIQHKRVLAALSFTVTANNSHKYDIYF